MFARHVEHGRSRRCDDGEFSRLRVAVDCRYRGSGAVSKGDHRALNEVHPDLIVIELGDGILGGYSVDTVFADYELLDATAALVFCVRRIMLVRGVALSCCAGAVSRLM